MPTNLIKGVRVNGTDYKIDYESLENRPFYKILTPGVFILPETTVTLVSTNEAGYIGLENPIPLADVAEIAPGDKFRITLDGTPYMCTAEIQNGNALITQDDGFNARIFISPSFDSSGFGLEGIFSGDAEGSHTLSVQKVTQALKVLDPELSKPIITMPAGGSAVFLETDLTLPDFVNGVIFNRDYAETIASAALNHDTGFFQIVGFDYQALYNPASGALFFGNFSENPMTTYNVSIPLGEGETYTEQIFLGSALVYQSPSTIDK